MSTMKPEAGQTLDDVFQEFLRWDLDEEAEYAGDADGVTLRMSHMSYEGYRRAMRMLRQHLQPQPAEDPDECISHDEHRGEWRCKNAALPGKDHCSECADEEPQPPKKTRVRLWKNAYGSVMSNPDCENIEGWREIRVDSEGFYVEGDQS